MNKLLKAKIVEKFGSQTEFAKIIGSSEAKISRVVRGHNGLKSEERQRWTIVLGCDDPEKLFHQNK